jgi:predicted nucleotidyltransferase
LVVLITKKAISTRSEPELLRFHVELDEAVCIVFPESLIINRSPFVGLSDVSKALEVLDGGSPVWWLAFFSVTPVLLPTSLVVGQSS